MFFSSVRVSRVFFCPRTYFSQSVNFRLLLLFFTERQTNWVKNTNEKYRLNSTNIRKRHFFRLYNILQQLRLSNSGWPGWGFRKTKKKAQFISIRFVVGKTIYQIDCDIGNHNDIFVSGYLRFYIRTSMFDLINSLFIHVWIFYFLAATSVRTTGKLPGVPAGKSHPVGG